MRNPDEVAESDELDRVAGRADLPVNLPPSADSVEKKKKKEREGEREREERKKNQVSCGASKERHQATDNDNDNGEDAMRTASRTRSIEDGDKKTGAMQSAHEPRTQQHGFSDPRP